MFKLPKRDQELFNSIEEFELTDRLGKGAFSIVYEAKNKKSGYRYAIKVIDFFRISLADQENIEKEIEAHRLMNHKNIIMLYDYFMEDDNVYLVMELCNNGSLFRYMYHNKHKLSLEEIKRIFKQTCDAVAYIHNKEYIIRDIKPENMLMDKYHNVKLCDFGWAGHKSSKEYLTLQAGTLSYMSPESLLGQPQSFPSDIWSLGILLFELHHYKEPFIASTCQDLIKVIKYPGIQFKEGKMDKVSKSLCEKLLQYKAEDRPDFDFIYQSDFLYDYESQFSIKELPSLQRNKSVHLYEKIPEKRVISRRASPEVTQEKYELNFIQQPKQIVKPKTIFTARTIENKKSTLPLNSIKKKTIKPFASKNRIDIVQQPRIININAQKNKKYRIRGEKELSNVKFDLIKKDDKKTDKQKGSILNEIDLFKDYNNINYNVNRKKPSKSVSKNLKSAKLFDLKDFVKKVPQNHIKKSVQAIYIAEIDLKRSKTPKAVFTRGNEFF